MARTAKPVSDAQALTEHELTGLFAEAYEAYDYQDERIRFDTLGRKWTFRPDVRDGHSALALVVAREPVVYQADYIATPLLASDLGKPMVEDVVRALNKALA